jgi:hypothetical protein
MNENIKVGDVLFSKKNNRFFHKDSYYTVIKIDKSSEELFGCFADIVRYVQVSSNNSPYLHNFILNKSDEDNYIWNYFYKEQEMRKMKLKKINKNENLLEDRN